MTCAVLIIQFCRNTLSDMLCPLRCPSNNNCGGEWQIWVGNKTLMNIFNYICQKIIPILVYRKFCDMCNFFILIKLEQIWPTSMKTKLKGEISKLVTICYKCIHFGLFLHPLSNKLAIYSWQKCGQFKSERFGSQPFLYFFMSAFQLNAQFAQSHLKKRREYICIPLYCCWYIFSPSTPWYDLSLSISRLIKYSLFVSPCHANDGYK